MNIKDDEINEMLKKHKPKFEFPNPSPQPIKLNLTFNKERSFSNEFSFENKIITPQHQFTPANLLEMVHSELKEKKESKTAEKKKKSIISIFDDTPLICFGTIVKESFERIDDEIEIDGEVEAVYELFPEAGDSFDFLSMNIDKNDFVVEVVEKNKIKDVPSVIKIEEKEFNCMPTDMSEYVCVFFVGNQAYYKEIGANLNIKPK